MAKADTSMLGYCLECLTNMSFQCFLKCIYYGKSSNISSVFREHEWEERKMENTAQLRP